MMQLFLCAFTPILLIAAHWSNRREAENTKSNMHALIRLRSEKIEAIAALNALRGNNDE